MNYKILIASASFILVLGSCTKLEEKYNSHITYNPSASAGSNPNVANLLTAVYSSMRGTFQGQEGVWALSEMTTDELIGPTRGGDWDDNGAWRVLHSHRFDADHIRIREVYENLGSVIYQATDLLRYNPTAQQAAEAKLIRAMASYLWLDGWDQVPYREPGESTVAPAKVRKGIDAFNYIVSEINAALPNLPNGPATIANKDAAKVLLMKCYLNKGVYKNRTSPTFDAADMQQVITLADQVIGSSRGYSFSTKYFDNFAPNNNVIGKENIWTQENVGGTSSGPIRSRWHSVTHYNQNPSGWNGFSTLSDFYNKFEATDTRRGIAYPTNSATYTNPGNRINIGFMVGQQYNLSNDAELNDRTGAKLSFTPAVSIIEKGTNLEVTGIRAYKYAIDYPNADNGNWDNDYVYLRLGDVLLMKAEAQLRSSNAAGALLGVNALRANRGATPLASLTLDNLIDERGRELYLESWRRQDLIRFGKFLQAYQEKPASSNTYLLFPIPNTQLAANPNLTQNPGY
jgi:starch-binding outer membrane protein, SusD/RagB family